MLNPLVVKRREISSLIFLLFIPCLAFSYQNKTLVIKNTNIAYERCMLDAPKVEVIRECNNASLCWAKWLGQYQQAKHHQTACIRAHGGNDYSYHYPAAVKLNKLANK